jgi:hypothetical protein
VAPTYLQFLARAARQGPRVPQKYAQLQHSCRTHDFFQSLEITFSIALKECDTFFNKDHDADALGSSSPEK